MFCVTKKRARNAHVNVPLSLGLDWGQTHISAQATWYKGSNFQMTQFADFSLHPFYLADVSRIQNRGLNLPIAFFHLRIAFQDRMHSGRNQSWWAKKPCGVRLLCGFCCCIQPAQKNARRSVRNSVNNAAVVFLCEFDSFSVFPLLQTRLSIIQVV